jgi:hypothetical protein
MALGLCGCSLIHQITSPSSVAIQKFHAEPTTINAGGQTVLSWTVNGADAVQIDNGIGSVAAEGTTKVAPQWSTTYTLAARSGSLQTQASVTVVVVPANTAPPTPAPSPTPSPTPSPSATPTPTPSSAPSSPPPSLGGPVAKAAVGVMFVVCDNQGLPNSTDATNVQVGCKVHMIVNLKDAHGVQVDNKGPIDWHFSNPSLIDVVADPETPILKVLQAGDLTVWVTVDGVHSNNYNLHFYN